MSNTNGATNAGTSSTSIYGQDGHVKQGRLSNDGTDDVWLHFGAGPAVDKEGTKLSKSGSPGDTLHLTGGLAQSELFGIVGTTISAVAFSRITDV